MDTILLPRISVYYDFAEIEGLYATFSIAHGWHIIKNRMDFDLRLGLGLATENYIEEVFGVEADEEAGIEEFEADGAGLVDLTVSAAFPIIISPSTMLTPEVRYSSLMDSDIADAQDSQDIDADQLVYGVTFSMMF